jgi:hypothetical protein
MVMAVPVRVRVEEIEDLEVLASILQDALIPISEITYQFESGRFLLMAQRFCWERLGATRSTSCCNSNMPQVGNVIEDSMQRIICAITIEGVESVQVQGLDLMNRSQVFNILTFQFNGRHLDFLFSENKTIRLIVKGLSIFAEDIGHSWPTSQRPNHQDTEYDC